MRLGERDAGDRHGGRDERERAGEQPAGRAQPARRAAVARQGEADGDDRRAAAGSGKPESGQAAETTTASTSVSGRRAGHSQRGGERRRVGRSPARR